MTPEDHDNRPKVISAAAIKKLRLIANGRRITAWGSVQESREALLLMAREICDELGIRYDRVTVHGEEALAMAREYTRQYNRRTRNRDDECE